MAKVTKAESDVRLWRSQNMLAKDQESPSEDVLAASDGRCDCARNLIRRLTSRTKPAYSDKRRTPNFETQMGWSPNYQPIYASGGSIGRSYVSPPSSMTRSSMTRKYSEDGDGYCEAPDDADADLAFTNKTTVGETRLNATLALVGGGVLAIPFSFGQSGLLLFGIMVLVSVITYATALLIGMIVEASKPLAKSFDLQESVLDWPFMGYAAFGVVGQSFTTTIFVVELWFIMLSYLVANGINVHIVCPSISLERGIVLCGFSSFLLLFPSAKCLSYFSFLGIISTFIAVSSLFWSAGVMSEWYTTHHEIVWLKPQTLAEALGIVQFCVVAHATFPTMYRGMQDTTRFSTAMAGAFVVACLFYSTIGAAAYFVYGSFARASFMENLGRDLQLAPIPGYSFLYAIASFCFGVNLQFSFPLFASGLMTATEGWLGIESSGAITRGLWKVVFMALTTALAVLLKDCMASIVSLTGCLCSTFTCLLMPIVYSWRLCTFTPFQQFIMFVGVSYGLFIVIYGTYNNVMTILATTGVNN